MNYKVAISIIAVMLAFVGYVPYIRDILKRKTVPHTFTWLVWTLAVGITCALQIVGGAGVGAWTTVAVTLIAIAILILSFRFGHTDITRTDIIFLLLALAALGFWIFAKQPIWSAVLIIVTDLLGFIPTIRKSWHDPHSETLSTYQITGFRQILSIFALQQFNFLTLFYPAVWAVANVMFSVMLMMRRVALR